MLKCSFCKSEIEPGTGKMMAWNDGRIEYFCSRKCEKNKNILKRDPSRMKWIVKKKK